MTRLHCVTNLRKLGTTTNTQHKLWHEPCPWFNVISHVCTTQELSQQTESRHTYGVIHTAHWSSNMWMNVLRYHLWKAINSICGIEHINFSWFSVTCKLQYNLLATYRELNHSSAAVHIVSYLLPKKVCANSVYPLKLYPLKCRLAHVDSKIWLKALGAGI